MCLRSALSFLLLLVLAAGCGPRRGAVDAETGLQGIQVGEGELSGTWAQRTMFATIVSIPVVGKRESGGGSTRLVHRTWNAAEQRYEESFLRCTNDVIETEGARTIVKDETLAAILPAAYTSTADHEAGAWTSDLVLDIWGLRDLPDPLETPLPTPDNFEEAPQRDWVWDEDGDGNPGVTVLMRGTLSADLFVIKRNVYAFEGTVVAEDRIQGLIRQQSSQSNSLRSTVSWLEGEGSADPNPDPLRSWFDMARLPDGAGCDEVKAAVEDGRLQTDRPF
jgi:hypothetical protein